MAEWPASRKRQALSALPLPPEPEVSPQGLEQLNPEVSPQGLELNPEGSPQGLNPEVSPQELEQLNQALVIALRDTQAEARKRPSAAAQASLEDTPEEPPWKLARRQPMRYEDGTLLIPLHSSSALSPPEQIDQSKLRDAMDMLTKTAYEAGEIS